MRGELFLGQLNTGQLPQDFAEPLALAGSFPNRPLISPLRLMLPICAWSSALLGVRGVLNTVDTQAAFKCSYRHATVMVVLKYNSTSEENPLHVTFLVKTDERGDNR